MNEKETEHTSSLSLDAFDEDYRRRWGIELLGGIDEAGRGPYAGPVVAGCVVFGSGITLPGINDSKQLTERKRESLVPQILDKATAWGLGWATPAEIDELNILQATLLAAERALASCDPRPEGLLTDYLKLPEFFGIPLEPLTKGDARSQAIAAASVLAKVARDRIMIALDEVYPQYGFAKNKGYGGARVHREALSEYGVSGIHRLSFRPVCEAAQDRPLVAPEILTHQRLASANGHPPDWHQILTHPVDEWQQVEILTPCLYSV